MHLDDYSDRAEGGGAYHVSPLLLSVTSAAMTPPGEPFVSPSSATLSQERGNVCGPRLPPRCNC